MFIRAGGSVRSVPATAIFGHLVIFVIAHFRRWRFYKFVVNSYTRLLFERYFRIMLKLVLQITGKNFSKQPFYVVMFTMH